LAILAGAETADSRPPLAGDSKAKALAILAGAETADSRPPLAGDSKAKALAILAGAETADSRPPLAGDTKRAWRRGRCPTLKVGSLFWQRRWVQKCG